MGLFVLLTGFPMSFIDQVAGGLTVERASATGSPDPARESRPFGEAGVVPARGNRFAVLIAVLSEIRTHSSNFLSLVDQILDQPSEWLVIRASAQVLAGGRRRAKELLPMLLRPTEATPRWCVPGRNGAQVEPARAGCGQQARRPPGRERSTDSAAHSGIREHGMPTAVFNPESQIRINSQNRLCKVYARHGWLKSVTFWL